MNRDSMGMMEGIALDVEGKKSFLVPVSSTRLHSFRHFPPKVREVGGVFVPYDLQP